MQLETFLDHLQASPETIEFQDTMAVIEASYVYTPVTFRNGSLVNQAGENEGSCKIFAFAKINQLSKESTLASFGAYYREDVLRNPYGDNHQNIRNFMKTGWSGIELDSETLVLKES